MTAPAVPGCVLVVMGGLLLLKGMYGWFGLPDRVAARPLQHDRVVVYVAALVVAVGAALFVLGGESGPGGAVLVTALVPVLLVLPGAYANRTAIYTCLMTTPIGAAMALRTVLLPKTPVTAVAVLVFAVVALAGGYLLPAILDAVPIMSSFSDEEVHRQAIGRLTAGLASMALASVPVALLFAGRMVAAALTVPFIAVAPIAIRDSRTLLALLVYLITGPLAMGAAVYMLFAGR